MVRFTSLRGLLFAVIVFISSFNTVSAFDYSSEMIFIQKYEHREYLNNYNVYIFKLLDESWWLISLDWTVENREEEIQKWALNDQIKISLEGKLARNITINSSIVLPVFRLEERIISNISRTQQAHYLWTIITFENGDKMGIVNNAVENWNIGDRVILSNSWWLPKIAVNESLMEKCDFSSLF